MTRWSMMCFIFNWLQWNVFLNKIISFKVVWCESQDFCLERRWKHLSQICLVCVPCWWFFEDFWMERFPFPVLSVHFRSRVFLIVPSFFNAVASHQCSHLMRLAQTDSTPVKSYSNLSVRRCKNRLFGKQQTDGVTAISSSGAHRCIQHSVAGIWCQHWGIFHEHL